MEQGTRRPQSGRKRSVPHVLLAGQPSLLRDALHIALTAEKMEVSVVDADDTPIADLVATCGADVVLIPEGDPDVTIDLIRSVVEIGSSAVPFTRDAATVESARFLGAGASLVVGLDTPYATLARLIKDLSNGALVAQLGQRYELEEKLRAHLKAEAHRVVLFEELSASERAIFALVYEGLSADQIADEQCVSISTVRTHIRKILTKLNVHSQLAAVAMARSHNWFELTNQSS